MNLSINIVNYYSIFHLKNLLSIIFNHLVKLNIDFEINIIDKIPEFDLMNSLEQYFPDYCKFINVYNYDFDGERNFSTGQNFLIEKSKGKYLLIFNPLISKKITTEVKYGFFLKIIPLFRSKVVDYIKPSNCKIFKISKSNYFKDLNDDFTITFVNGLFILIEKKTIEAVNGFSLNSFIEFNICKKVLKKFPWQIITLPFIRAKSIDFIFSQKEKIFPEYKKIFSSNISIKTLSNFNKAIDIIFEEKYKKSIAK